jgi:hypothetical protein
MLLETLQLYAVRISYIGVALVPLAPWIGGGYIVFKLVKFCVRKWEGDIWYANVLTRRSATDSS